MLYFVLFMAARLELLSPVGALWTMLALVLAVALLALAADAEVLAALSTLGGFMAPILLSTGSADYLGLFGYYALLTLGNAFLLRFKAWDIPALISFAAVYGIGGLWGGLYYEPSMFLHIELFLLLFFALFSFMHLQLARHADAWTPCARLPDLARAARLFRLMGARPLPGPTRTARTFPLTQLTLTASPGAKRISHLRPKKQARARIISAAAFRQPPVRLLRTRPGVICMPRCCSACPC